MKFYLRYLNHLDYPLLHWLLFWLHLITVVSGCGFKKSPGLCVFSYNFWFGFSDLLSGA